MENGFPAHVIPQLCFFKLLVCIVFVFGQQRLWPQPDDSPNLSLTFSFMKTCVAFWMSFLQSAWLLLGKSVRLLLLLEKLKEKKA